MQEVGNDSPDVLPYFPAGQGIRSTEPEGQYAPDGHTCSQAWPDTLRLYIFPAYDPRGQGWGHPTKSLLSEAGKGTFANTPGGHKSKCISASLANTDEAVFATFPSAVFAPPLK